MNIQNTNKDNCNSNTILYIFGFVIFFLPFFRGLFFEREMYTASIILLLISIIGILKVTKTESKIKFFSPLQFFSFLFVLLYIIMVFFAYNKQLASFEAIKNTTFFIVFLVISYAIKENKDLSFINIVLILSGLVVAVIGFGTAFGSFTYKSAFIDGMINSTFQYHNTFGAYMLGILFLTMAQITQSKKTNKYLLTGSGYVLFLGLIFSYSRGAWMLLPIVGLIALILLKEDGLKNVFLSFINILISFAITFNGIYKSASNTNTSGWMWIILGFIISGGLTFLSDKASNKFKINKKYLIISILALSILGFLGLTSGTIVKYLPESVAQRISAINLKTFTVVERNVFYKDGLKIVKENPFLGTGGGGWQSLYNKYKTYQYSTTQSHNYIMQVWIEIGTFGLIIFAGMILSFIYTSYRLIKNIDEVDLYNKIIGVICALTALIAHTIIDFDMALGAYAITVWILLGMIISLERKYLFVDKKKNIIFSIPKSVFIALSIIIILFISGSKIGNIYAQKGIDIAKNKDFELVKKEFKKASVVSPYIASYKMDLANIDIVLAKQQNSKELIEESRNNAQKALELGKTDFKILKNVIMYYFKLGDVNTAFEVAKKLEEYYPIDDGTYNELIEINYAMASYYIEKQDVKKGIEYFKNILDIEKKVNNLNKDLENKKNTLLQGVKDVPQGYVKDRFKIDLNEKSMGRINKAKVFLGLNK
ncbi:O-antigen ligase family protein [Tepidibacter formicigenes]|jgi:O-antigen ligase|uniref:O-antigen ligase n=1 Tax=Tepidibacter formicigenes DSM 15518 TaxID=1123349 RepID=A0A1M6QV46_9FIRM|nr:O-antigen ligase family protein [Tepidibacter formicigenes]SHK23993.1 O-antigen ligase [Tepidibacter formicigenes DSM 15518]